MAGRDYDENQSKTWFRSERFYAVNNEWYFSTREGIEVGPFASKKAAATGLEQFVEHMKHPAACASMAASMSKNGPWATNRFR